MPTINGFVFPSFVTGYQSNNFGGLESFPQTVKLGVFSYASGPPVGANVASTPGSLLIAVALTGSSVAPTISDGNGNTWTPLHTYAPGTSSGICVWTAIANGSSTPLVVNFSCGANGNSFYGVIQLPAAYVSGSVSGDTTGNSFTASVTVGGYTLSLNLHFNGPWELFMIQWGAGVAGNIFRLAFLHPGSFNIVNHALPAGWIEADSNGSPNYQLFPATGFGEVSFAFSDVVQAPPPPITSPCVPVDGNGNLTAGAYISDLGLFILPETALYTNPILPNAITTSELNNEGRRTIVLDFNNGDGLYARDLGTVFEWPTNNGIQVSVWQPSIIPMPEATYSRASDWDDAGSPGAKFIQGAIVEAFSFGNPKTFFLQDSDTLTLHSLNECPTTFSRQQEVAFSCSPFIAHSVRLISSDGIEWRVWKSRVISQPFPELTMNWQTELTSLGMTGWAHAREMNLAYISTAPVTLTLSFDWTSPIAIALPSTFGSQNKTRITLPPNKWKLLGFQLSSTAPFRVFQGDIEVKLREWGAQGPYGVVKPFGGKSSDGAAV